MLIYNIQLNVDDSIHDEWFEWMKKKHIPDVMNTGCFKESKIFRVLSPEPEEGTTNYVVHYVCNNLEDYEKYQIEHAAFLQSEHKDKFGSKFTAYRTLMEKA